MHYRDALGLDRGVVVAGSEGVLVVLDRAEGVVVAGTKYMYLSTNDKVIRAKKGTSGVHTIKTTQSKFF